MITRKEFIDTFLKIRKCAGCGEILLPRLVDTAFCDDCRIKWNASLTKSCETCFKSATECECMPKILSRAGALSLRRVFFYDKENSRRAPMSIIFWLKYRKSRRIVRFVGEYLNKNIEDELITLDYPENKESFVVTFVPRSRRSRMLYGYDQSAMLAENLSRQTGIECIKALRSLSRREQKRLDSKSRAENAKNSIVFNKGADVSGKYVILIDDIVTTGASMAACVRLLQKAGARGILCFALATKNKM